MTQGRTPRPWNFIVADNDGEWVTRDGTVISPPNAHLIAAAPDMLEALKETVEFGMVPKSIADKIRAAIEKAEGGDA